MVRGRVSGRTAVSRWVRYLPVVLLALALVSCTSAPTQKAAGDPHPRWCPGTIRDTVTLLLTGQRRLACANAPCAEHAQLEPATLP